MILQGPTCSLRRLSGDSPRTLWITHDFAFAPAEIHCIAMERSFGFCRFPGGSRKIRLISHASAILPPRLS